MFALWRSAAVAIGAFCFPSTFVASPLNGDTIPTAIAVRAAQYGTMGLTHWSSYLPQYWRGVVAPCPSDEPTTLPTTLIENESLPELPPIQVPSTPWLYLEDSDGSFVVVDSQGRCNDPTCPCHEAVELDPPSQSDDGEPNRAGERLDGACTQIHFEGSIEFLDEDAGTAGAVERASSQVESTEAASSHPDEEI